VSDSARPIVVTRTEAPGSGLSGELTRLALPVLHWPVVGIAPAEPGEWDEPRRTIGTFDWIVFTSVHAVEAVTDVLAPPSGARIAAVGPATAEALRERGWRVDLTGVGHGAEGLLAGLAAVGVRGRRMLHPASSRALPALAEGLTRLGAEVVRFVAYRTVAAALDVEACRGWIARRALGVVTFASPSAVIELERALGEADFAQLLANAPALAIGPTTARELEARAVAPRLAAEHTLHGLALACLALQHATAPGLRPIAGGDPGPSTAPTQAEPNRGWDGQAALRTDKRHSR
jgi:uroporphyrinogen III methyltransferase/synthase